MNLKLFFYLVTLLKYAHLTNPCLSDAFSVFTICLILRSRQIASETSCNEIPEKDEHMKKETQEVTLSLAAASAAKEISLDAAGDGR